MYNTSTSAVYQQRHSPFESSNWPMSSLLDLRKRQKWIHINRFNLATFLCSF